MPEAHVVCKTSLASDPAPDSLGGAIVTIESFSMDSIVVVQLLYTVSSVLHAWT